MIGSQKATTIVVGPGEHLDIQFPNGTIHVDYIDDTVMLDFSGIEKPEPRRDSFSAEDGRRVDHV